MKYQIIGDSSLDLNEGLTEWIKPTYAPFYIEVEDRTFVDDETLDLKELLEAIHSSKKTCKTAAPTPMDYIKCVDDDSDGVFIIALSSKLSGSYNSALVAKELLLEKKPNVKVHVVDSLTASAGETTLAIAIQKAIDAGQSFEEIVETVENQKQCDQTLFMLEDISTLMKNGRMSLLKGSIAQFLHIKPILGENGTGEIKLFDKARTTSAALNKLKDMYLSQPYDVSDRTLIIAHCMALEKAEILKSLIEKENKYKDVQIVAMKGLSSVYANLGGLVCSS